MATNSDLAIVPATRRPPRPTFSPDGNYVYYVTIKERSACSSNRLPKGRFTRYLCWGAPHENLSQMSTAPSLSRQTAEDSHSYVLNWIEMRGRS